jgi:hypothetical protein
VLRQEKALMTMSLISTNLLNTAQEAVMEQHLPNSSMMAINPNGCPHRKKNMKMTVQLLEKLKFQSNLFKKKNQTPNTKNNPQHPMQKKKTRPTMKHKCLNLRNLSIILFLFLNLCHVKSSSKYSIEIDEDIELMC